MLTQLPKQGNKNEWMLSTLNHKVFKNCGQSGTRNNVKQGNGTYFQSKLINSKGRLWGKKEGRQGLWEN